MASAVPVLTTQYRTITFKVKPGVHFFASRDSVVVQETELPIGSLAVFTGAEDHGLYCTVSYVLSGVDGDFGTDEVREAVDALEKEGLLIIATTLGGGE